MAFLLDTVALGVITFLLSLVLTDALMPSLAGAAAVSACVAVSAVIVAVYIRKRRFRPYHPDRLAAELCVRGTGYLLDLLARAAGGGIERGDDYLKRGDTVWLPAFNFRPLAAADFCRLLRRAEELGAKRAVLITRAADRRAFGVFAFFPLKVSVVRTRALYRFLARRGALPPLEKRRFSFSLRAFLTVALSRKNLKNYLFTGTLLLSIAFLTPLKGLYLAFGCLSLVLALLTLTPLGENEGGGSGLGGLAGDDEEYTRIPRTPSDPTNEE